MWEAIVVCDTADSKKYPLQCEPSSERMGKRSKHNSKNFYYRRHNERGVSWLMTQKCPSQLRSEYQQRQEVSCPLRIGELSLEIVLPEPEGNIGFVSWDLMSSTMDCGKRKLCVTPLGEVTSNLTVDIIDLPGVA
jgi:hypothetical protein